MDGVGRLTSPGRIAALGAIVATIAAGSVLAAPAGAFAPHVKFLYTGAEEEYTVPGAVTLLAFSAQGGEGGGQNLTSAPASATGFLPVSAGQLFYVEVGGEGKYGSTEAPFGGGGPGGTPPPEHVGGDALASSGGGASDLRTVSRKEASSLASRVLVAAGSGGNGGNGDGVSQICGVGNLGGGAGNPQPLPAGNAAFGPLPIKLTGGIVVPGYYTADAERPGDKSRMTVEGVLDAGPGTNLGGLPGEATSCSEARGPENTATASESLPGSAGAEGAGGSGANAASLPPSKVGCSEAEHTCANAGAGGGGGGGYFGGGGGATGYNHCSTTKAGACNVATSGEGGAAGSSYFANPIVYPAIASSQSGSRAGLLDVVPVVEIASPAPGANYAPGTVVKASSECLTGTGYDNSPQLVGCKATKTNGEAVDTSKGVHTFVVSSEWEHKPVSSTITYTALEAPTVTKVARGGGPVGGGTSVTITGTNFEDVTAVSFGSVHATSYTVESATKIKAVAPAEPAGRVDVRVSTGGGTSAISTGDHYAYAPTVSGVSPAEGPSAGGTKVTISGSGFSTVKGATVLKFGTAKATSVECTSSTSCTATTPAHAAGAVDVHATVNKATNPKEAGDTFTYV